MCFTHWDLDGVLCYLVLKWTFPKDQIEYEATTAQTFRNTFTKWLSNHDLEDYDKVFIMDLGIYEDKDLIDYKNVFIIDHHPGHDKSTYKNAKTAIKNTGSACALAYKIFKGLYGTNFTKPQLHLIALAHDFDAYKLKDERSAKLNIVFWDSTNKFETFIKSFINGFNGFTLKQLNIIKIHDLALQKIKEGLDVYGGYETFQGKKRYVCATFANKYINEVADTLLKDYKSDIALVINIATNHVSYRRRKDGIDIDLSKIAAELGDGAGHEFSSGSKITENFENFTKKLIKI